MNPNENLTERSIIKKYLLVAQKISSIIPGFLLAVIISIGAVYFRKAIICISPGLGKGLSQILLTIILGLIIGNLFKIPDMFNPGIKFCVVKILRLGIILMGIRLSLFAMAKIGLLSAGLVIACISAGLFITALVVKKLGISGRLGTLIAAGTGICGVSAIIAISPGINATEEETSYAVGIITLFGVFATFFYPYLTHSILSLSTIQSGLFMGTAIHDTSQVTGAGLIYDQLWADGNTHLSAADIAITVKMVRNLFMLFVIPLLSFLYVKKETGNAGTVKTQKLKSFFPVFLIGFVFMALVRTIGDHLILNKNPWCTHETWIWYCESQKQWAEYILAIALSGVGLNTKFSKLKILGIKPVLAGFSAAVSVGLASFILIKILAPYLITL